MEEDTGRQTALFFLPSTIKWEIIVKYLLKSNSADNGRVSSRIGDYRFLNYDYRLSYFVYFAED